MTKVIGDNKARQGGTGRPVLYVLIGSFVLVAIYLVSLLGWSGATSPPGPSQPSPPTTSSGSAPRSNVPAGNPAYPAPPGGSGTAAPR